LILAELSGELSQPLLTKRFSVLTRLTALMRRLNQTQLRRSEFRQLLSLLMIDIVNVFYLIISATVFLIGSIRLGSFFNQSFVAIVHGKVITGWVVFGQAGINRLAIGIGMIPRGEVGLVFAGIGSASGTLDKPLAAAMIIMVILTTFLAPPLLFWRLTSQLKCFNK
jgi:Kef-type K+ transport system membrane component KefB